MESIRPPQVARSRTALVAKYVLAAVILVGVALRFIGLERRPIGHPENNVPRLVVPTWVQEPTSRMDLASVLRGNVHDGHPPTWFVGMYAWTGLFGTSLTAIRWPSALFGALALLLLFRLARRVANESTAWVATALLALCGIHLFWSQTARMYSLACFLGLASTLLLLRAQRSGSRASALAYASCAALGLWTHLYLWPLHLGHIVWAALRAARRSGAASILGWQFAAVVAALPVVALSLHQNPRSSWHEPAWEFFDLGYAFMSKASFHRPAPHIVLPRILVRIATLGLVLVGLSHRRWEPPVSADGACPSRALLFLTAALSSASIASFAAAVTLRPGESRLPLFALALVPLVLATAAQPIVRAIARVPSRLVAFEPPLAVVLAVLPVGLMALVSLARGVFIARGALVFLPYLMLAVAIGIDRLATWGIPRAVPLAALLFVQVASVRYHAQAQISPVDGRALARGMAAHVRPDDLVLVHNNWRYAPLYYDTTVPFERFAWRERRERIAAHPAGRVWIIAFTAVGSAALLEFVPGYRIAEQVRVPGVQALLFVPPLAEDRAAPEPR